MEPDELKAAAVSGVRWVTAARIATEVLQFGVAVALARLVGPAEFGRAVVALIFIPLAVILTFEGFGSALVQRQEIGRAHIESATFASIVTGATLSVATFVLAEPVAGHVFGKGTVELIQMVSPVFLLAGLGAVPRSLLWRRLDFRKVSVIETAGLAAGGFTSIALALAGLDAEALVLGGVASTFAMTAMFLLAERPTRPRWHRHELTEIGGFGVPASLSGLTYVGISNVSYAVLAARLSASQVGIFWRAFQLGVSYQEKISGIMMRLAFPIYSRTRDLVELRRLHERATRVHAAVVVPLLALLIVTAPDLVPWLFGEPWSPAVVPAQILAGAGMIAAILTGYPQLLLAAGRPRALFGFNAFLLALYAGVMWVVAPLGLTAVAIAVVGIHIVMLATVYLVLFERLLGIPVKRLVTDLAPGVGTSLAVVAAALPVAELLRGADAPAPVTIAGAGLAALAAYLIAIRALFPAVSADLSALARRLLPRGPLARRAAAAVSTTTGAP